MSKFVLIMGILWISGGTLYAETGGKTGNYFEDIGSKLGRGVGNVITSIGEVPCGMLDNSVDKGLPGVFAGIGMGTARMVYRLGFGVVEVGTFFVPTDKVLPAPCKEGVD